MHSSAIVEPSSIPSQIFSSAEQISNKLLADKPALVVTSVAVLIGLLILEQTVYRSKKGALPGSRWTIPIIGKFAESLNPTLENYKRQWNSGELSALSVFNMCVPRDKA
jgi:sterol 22-desaturase